MIIKAFEFGARPNLFTSFNLFLYRLTSSSSDSIFLFNCKIKMISERKGERMGQSAKQSNGFKKLNYKQKYNIKSYISDFITK